MKKLYSIATILGITVMVLGMSGIAYAEKPIIIKVGHPSPLSGPVAPWGTLPIPAYEAFVELFNKEGFKVGGKTYNFKVVFVDDEVNPAIGAAMAKKLIYEDKVKAIVGHWSWTFPATAAVTNQAKVILLTRTGNEAVPGGLYDPKKMPYVAFCTPSQEMFVSNTFAIIKAFPDYKKIIPVQREGYFTADKNLLYSAIKRVSILVEESYNQIKLNISKDKLLVSSQNPELGGAVEEIPIQYSGEQIEIALNYIYLIDCLKEISHDIVKIDFENSERVLSVRGEDEEGYINLIMPMKGGI